MQTEHAVCWGAEFPLAGEAEVVWVLWQVPSQIPGAGLTTNPKML